MEQKISIFGAAEKEKGDDCAKAVRNWRSRRKKRFPGERGVARENEPTTAREEASGGVLLPPFEDEGHVAMERCIEGRATDPPRG